MQKTIKNCKLGGVVCYLFITFAPQICKLKQPKYKGL